MSAQPIASGIRIGVVGCGAIGLCLARSLDELDLQHALLLREPLPARARINFRGLNGDTTIFESPVRTAGDTGGPYDLLLVPTKAHQVAPALAQLRGAIHPPTTTICLLHNGLGTLEQLQDLPHCRRANVLLGATSHGALKLPPDSPATHSVQHTGRGATWIGLGQGEPPEAHIASLRSVLDGCFAPAEWHPSPASIMSKLWAKLAVNCAINPLTAAHNCQNGDLLQPRFRSHVAGICGEVARVMGAVDELSGGAPTPEELEATVRRVASATQHNWSSMQQDIAHGRPTEIQHINGYVCRVAQLHGIAVPRNEALVEAIVALETGRRS